MAWGWPDIDWSKSPTKYHVAKSIKFVHEGWGADMFYKKLRSILTDLRYVVQEVRYVYVTPNTPNDPIFMTTWFRANHESDYKYTYQWIYAKMNISYLPKPKPGSDPKNPQLVNYGKVDIAFDGLLTTDTSHRWTKSAVLRYLRPFREKYIYRDKMMQWADNTRNDINFTMQKLNEYANYLPTVL